MNIGVTRVPLPTYSSSRTHATKGARCHAAAAAAPQLALARARRRPPRRAGGTGGAVPAAPAPAPCLPRSAVAAQRDAVVLAPDGAARGARLVVEVPLAAQAAVGLARGGQAAQLAVLVHGVDNPVDARVLRE